MDIIDRFEGEFAVIETEDGTQNIPRTQLPEDAAEGDVLRRTEDGWETDAEATRQRRERLAARRRRMLCGGNK
ncbi:MAG: DUF3006 domain-containing protein [Oscillospiraceae bacterium]|nr:DUF3006 domain-containing protein [Oscillospiraceae bacterium]